MRWALRIAVGLVLVTGISFGLGVADASRAVGGAGASAWFSASRESAGLAPDPLDHADLAVVQVYAARTWGWRGRFAVHPWIIHKRAGETAYLRHEVIGWRAPDVVRRNAALPDGRWFGAAPVLLVDHRGAKAAAMIDAIEAAIASYPYADRYRSYPGPNSNTFLAHIGREVPALELDLPAHAIGKDYRPLTDPVGLSASGGGLQASLLGLLGLSVGLPEGVEINLLGLHFGVDLNPPALRLPFVGRLGMDPVPLAPSQAPTLAPARSGPGAAPTWAGQDPR
jgi:hypothetical protein